MKLEAAELHDGIARAGAAKTNNSRRGPRREVSALPGKDHFTATGSDVSLAGCGFLN